MHSDQLSFKNPPGIYFLAARTFLFELGGIENSPQEVEATIHQIATALGAIL